MPKAVVMRSRIEKWVVLPRCSFLKSHVGMFGFEQDTAIRSERKDCCAGRQTLECHVCVVFASMNLGMGSVEANGWLVRRYRHDQPRGD